MGLGSECSSGLLTVWVAEPRPPGGSSQAPECANGVSRAPTPSVCGASCARRAPSVLAPSPPAVSVVTLIRAASASPSVGELLLEVISKALFRETSEPRSPSPFCCLHDEMCYSLAPLPVTGLAHGRQSPSHRLWGPQGHTPQNTEHTRCSQSLGSVPGMVLAASDTHLTSPSCQPCSLGAGLPTAQRMKARRPAPGTGPGSPSQERGVSGLSLLPGPPAPM